MINELLKKKVKASKSTSDEIAEQVGTSRQQLWNYTDKGQLPHVQIANSLAKFFNMSTEELFPYYSKPREERYKKWITVPYAIKSLPI